MDMQGLERRCCNTIEHIEIFDNLETLAFEVGKRKAELNKELSKVDKEIADINHCIEFYPLNACQGYKMAKMLKERLQKRRDIKNESETLARISRMSVGDIGSGKGRNVLESTKTKKYQPRILVELFETKAELGTDNRKESFV